MAGDGVHPFANGAAAIAEVLGPYKLSLHSGSDKISMYTALARATKGRFHVKTAGTSYLEALRVIALCGLQFSPHEGVARHVGAPQERQNRIEHGDPSSRDTE